jgi:phage terminase large subunit-like protein
MDNGGHSWLAASPFEYKLASDTASWVVTKSDELAVNQGCYFDLNAALRVLQFFIRFVNYVDGPEAGKPFYPLPWQWERIIAPAFGWMMPDGTRRMREVEVWIPKKNGKSTLCAGLVLYTLLADREIGAKVYSAAADRKQASLIFEVAKTMVKGNPKISSLLKVKPTQKRIDCELLDAYYEVLSADAFRNEGHNIHGLFFDELHTQKTRALWAALRYGSAARKQGIRFVISTVGLLDEASLWWERFNFALAVQESRKIDINLLPCVYAMKESDDYTSEEVWKRVNPSWGYTVNPLEFRRDYENSKDTGLTCLPVRLLLGCPTCIGIKW